MEELPQISEQTLNYIRGEEGFSPSAYVDASGNSIGYGHFIKKGEEHLKGQQLSRDEAESLMRKDIHEHQKGWIGKAKEAKLSEEQITGLTSFAYNTGGAAIPRVIDFLKKGDTQSAMDLMGKYTYAVNPKTGRKEYNDKLAARRGREIAASVNGRIDTASKNNGSSPNTAPQFTTQQQPRPQQQQRQEKGFLQKAKEFVFGGGDDIADLNTNQLRQLNADFARICVEIGTVNNDSALFDRIRQEGTNTWAAS